MQVSDLINRNGYIFTPDIYFATLPQCDLIFALLVLHAHRWVEKLVFMPPLLGSIPIEGKYVNFYH
jgi:hypothetical protein